MDRVLIWDFDGTLGYRDGGWTGALLEIIQREPAAPAVTSEHICPHLQAGFPWHTPDQVWSAERSAEQWWHALYSVFERAYLAVGIDTLRARTLAKEVRHVYTDLSHWRLFDDAIPTLSTLFMQGWSHVLLSNHVPELRAILDHLQVSRHFAFVFNSAETGYEKPHPGAFRNVLTRLGNPADVWMIGDSLATDVEGAETVGIPAILVRKSHPSARYSCSDLTKLAGVLDAPLLT
ncbi:MAG: HAD-IA family hydrolase [Chloroflexia bacterium]